MSAYQRKTRTTEELREACRRAAMSRKHRRGGRPRTEPSGRPPKSIKVSAPIYETLEKIAAAYSITIKRTAESLINLWVTGREKPIPPHPQFAPTAQ